MKQQFFDQCLIYKNNYNVDRSHWDEILKGVYPEFNRALDLLNQIRSIEVKKRGAFAWRVLDVLEGVRVALLRRVEGEDSWL